MDELLTDIEAAELRLPQHVPGSKDEIEWSRPQSISAELSCSKCGAKVNRTLSLPANVSVGQIPFVCATCNGMLGGKSGKRRGRPPKARQPSIEASPVAGHEEQESLLHTLSAGLASSAQD